MRLAVQIIEAQNYWSPDPDEVRCCSHCDVELDRYDRHDICRECEFEAKYQDPLEDHPSLEDR